MQNDKVVQIGEGFVVLLFVHAVSLNHALVYCVTAVPSSDSFIEDTKKKKKSQNTLLQTSGSWYHQLSANCLSITKATNHNDPSLCDLQLETRIYQRPTTTHLRTTIDILCHQLEKDKQRASTTCCYNKEKTNSQRHQNTHHRIKLRNQVTQSPTRFRVTGQPIFGGVRPMLLQGHPLHHHQSSLTTSSFLKDVIHSSAYLMRGMHSIP